MKNENEKVDLLLEKNAAEQLANVDWDQLSAAISTRLDGAGDAKPAAIKYSAVLKVAASLAAAAAVIVIAVALIIDKPSGLQLPQGRSAIVKILKPAGSASVVIEQTAAGRRAFVEIGQAHRHLAKCEVEIIDVNGDMDKGGSRAAWIIVRRPEPVYADNGASRDSMDLLCLF
ncbi:MAG: hypothetical protein ACYTEL_05395 [Planctomycetota bacterium]|jgi:hypothetical protein